MVGFPIRERYTVFWICQNIPWQSSEYISGFKYARILNLAGFWICNSYKGFYICHKKAEYVCIGYEYAWMSELTIIDSVLNMSHTIHNVTIQVYEFLLQQQPSKDVPRKKICNNFTGEHHFQSVISIKLLCNFIEIALWHGWSRENLLHIFTAPFNKNNSGRLLLLSWEMVVFRTLSKIKECGKHFGVFSPRYFRNHIWMEHLTQRWIKLKPLFSKSRALFLIFKKGQVRPPPPF